jgi:hypothetical protein
MAQLYLDLDGVLADFDMGAQAVLGMHPRLFQEQWGTTAFWRRLAMSKEFYNTLPLLPDAHRLMDAVAHRRPIILTGLPRGNWAEAQKRDWVERHFPGMRVITTMARDKPRYCKPGDILVDDQERYREGWEKVGGRFVHHVDAERTLALLDTMDGHPA